MSDWNSNQYLKFKKERTQPSLDLISRIANLSPSRILDIGCGPGNSTYELKKAFPDSYVLGIDYSENMLDKARESYPCVDFARCNVPSGLYEIDGSFDLIFSNACIQWIPEQYELFKAMFDKLNAGGTLAVQVPITHEAPFYQMLAEVVKNKKWSKLSDVRDFYYLMPEEYYDILCKNASSFDMWQTTYFHTVDGADGVLSWYSGSGLRPYYDALDEKEKNEFVSVLKNNINNIYQIRKNNKLILKMPRLFFIAEK